MDRKSQVYALYDALFALEDIRDVFRKSLPHELTQKEHSKICEKIKKVKKILDKLESQKGTQKQYIVDKLAPRIREEAFINIQPIQAAGRLTVQARKALIAYGDGYSVCDQCLSPFRLDKIKKPPINVFHEELADFLGMDEARVVPGARRGFQTVISSLVGKKDTVVLSSQGHYTEFLAIEQVGGIPREVPSHNNIVTGDAYSETIEKVKKESKLPKLVMVDHFDYQYGNEHEIREIAKAAHDYGIPFLLNGAYSVGIMPVNGKDIGADFVVGSGHKSMASAAPSGVVATTDEWADTIFRTTDIQGDITGRTFGIKEVEMLGCTLMGAPVVTMMASFPTVKKRVKTWDEEVKKSNYFCEQFKRISTTEILSEEPRNHTLTKVDTTQSFDTVAKTHKKRGYFLSSELKNRGITGPFAGATRKWKLNTYGLSWDQIKYVAESFIEISQKHDLPITG